ncbi:MAG: tyrosine-type recombinase/integrase [Acidimicrobiales bacterium]
MTTTTSVVAFDGSTETRAAIAGFLAGYCGATGPSRSKGGRRAVIPLALRTSRALDLYLGERAAGPIFVGAKGARMDRYAADRMVKRLARRAGITKRISPHSLRHSFITAALRRRGAPARRARRAGGGQPRRPSHHHALRQTSEVASDAGKGPGRLVLTRPE